MSRFNPRQAGGTALAINASPGQSLGDSGSWNTFEFSVGTPAMTYQLLPSTSTVGLWLVHPLGCTVLGNTNCYVTRGQTYQVDPGVGIISYQQSSTYRTSTPPNFLTGASSGFALPYSSAEKNISYSANGLSGTDNVTLSLGTGTGPTLQDQTIFSYVASTPWVGQFGLQPNNFSNSVVNYTSTLQYLKDNRFIPSLSYGYSSGLPGQTGSLTLGGYDGLRAGAEGVTIPLSATRDLTVSVTAMNAQNSTNSTSLMPDGPINITIDSMVPELWLPRSICAIFEGLLGLSYNTTLGLYTLSDDQSANLRKWNTSVTFTLGDTAAGSPTVDITLPFSAFDQVASYPYLNTTAGDTMNYFPLRQAANSSQFILGRTFLQGAYLITDFETTQFQLSQASYPSDPSQKNLQPIYPGQPIRSSSGDSSSNPTTPPSSGSGSNAGAIAGGVVGGVLGLAIIILLVYFCYYRPRQREKNSRLSKEANSESPQADSEDRDGSEQTAVSQGLLRTASEEKRHIAAHNASAAHEMDSPAGHHGEDVHEMYVQPPEVEDTSQRPEAPATSEEPLGTSEATETSDTTNTSPTTATTDTQHISESSAAHEPHVETGAATPDHRA